MDFITGLSILTNWKGENYDSILVIIGRLIKIFYYKPVKVIINAPRLVKLIINMIVWHHSLLDLIITDTSLLYTSKLWLLLCYFVKM